MSIRMDSESATEMELKFAVKHRESSKGNCCNVILKVKVEDTIRNVKEAIQKELGFQCSQQELKYEKQLLEDENSLSTYNIHRESTIELWITKFESTETESKLYKVQKQKHFHHVMLVGIPNEIS